MSEPEPGQEVVDLLVEQVRGNFRTMGGGRKSEFNPLANMLSDQPLMFAAGVPVEDVVRCILQRIMSA